MARQAVGRQARQTVLAAGIAALALLVLGPTIAGIRAGVAFAHERSIPLGEVFVIMMFCGLAALVVEETCLCLVRGRLRCWLMTRTVALYFAACVANVVLAQHDDQSRGSGKYGQQTDVVAGATTSGAAAIPIVFLIFALSRPVARFLRPDQRCNARLRRTLREVKSVPFRLINLTPGLTVILYVYMTVSTHLAPMFEVLIMGVGMPLLQAICMTLVARLMAREERRFHRRRTERHHKTSARSPSSSKAETSDTSTDGKEEKSDAESAKDELARQQARAAESTRRTKSKESKVAQISLIMVLMAEVWYSTGAFATLVLMESDEAVHLSLVLMLSIEVVQVALHIKARRVVSRVACDRTAETILGNNARILQWLLHQELGEKIGLLTALGFLAIEKSLWRHGVAVDSVSLTRLARRGLVMLLLELLGDVGKDIVSQMLGVIPSQPGCGAARVSLSPLSVALVIIFCVCAGLLVQIGLSLGAQSSYTTPIG